MDDNKLKSLLKEQSFKAEENPWFTHRVLNKLPRRQSSTSWITALSLVLACIACAVAWILMFKNFNFMVITVRDLLTFGALAAITTSVAVQSLRALIAADE
ncbi:MAG: DUF5056 domain-containing protein [Bacteroidales bacterium]|nr:DUF5056 domain-containing protein [Candidatus Sodaliphilus fimicaballi]